MLLTRKPNISMSVKQFLFVVHMIIMREFKTVVNMASTSKKPIEPTIQRRRIKNGIL